MLLFPGLLLLAVVGSAATNCKDDELSIASAPLVCMPYASDGDEMKHNPTINDTLSTYRWIMAGGRGVDSAWSYDHGGYGLSQRQMGVAIKQSGVPRSELFITTKIPVNQNVSAVDRTIDYDLAQLMVTQVDLLLIHTPAGNAKDIATTWSAMEAALAAGKARAIGVSNFLPSNLEALLTTAKVMPAVNQISFSIGRTNNATVSYCKAKGIVVEAYRLVSRFESLKWPIVKLLTNDH